jgi:acyl-coenzyme A thioesterase 13
MSQGKHRHHNDEEEATYRRRHDGGYWGMIGIETSIPEDGRSRCRVAVRDDHMNYNGVVHGGVISGLIDSAAGAAVGSTRKPSEVKERPHATTDLHVSYIAGARGKELLADAKVLKKTRSAIFVDVTVHDETDRLIAKGLVTFVITAGRPTVS